MELTPLPLAPVGAKAVERDFTGGRLSKPRQHLCYVYASLSRLAFRGLPGKLIIVFEGVIGFATAKKPTALMMHWWNGGRGGVCDAAVHRASGWQQARTGGTGHLLSTPFLGRRMVHNRLGHATGQLLP